MDRRPSESARRLTPAPRAGRAAFAPRKIAVVAATAATTRKSRLTRQTQPLTTPAFPSASAGSLTARLRARNASRVGARPSDPGGRHSTCAARHGEREAVAVRLFRELRSYCGELGTVGRDMFKIKRTYATQRPFTEVQCKNHSTGNNLSMGLGFSSAPFGFSTLLQNEKATA